MGARLNAHYDTTTPVTPALMIEESPQLERIDDRHDAETPQNGEAYNHSCFCVQMNAHTKATLAGHPGLAARMRLSLISEVV